MQTSAADYSSNIQEVDGSRQLALDAISGKVTERVPFALFTWGFDYYWKIAGIEPWKLACGSSESWHRAHIALYERHRPDILFYSGAGAGPNEPKLLDETADRWIFKAMNTGKEWEMHKVSYALKRHKSGEQASPEQPRELKTREDAEEMAPKFTGWGEPYLKGLTRLIEELGDKTLVLPHHSPAYICACYALGFEKAMEKILCEPDIFYYFCERFTDGDRLRMQELKEAGAEAVFIADGWASCDIISPEQFKRFAWPFQKSIAEAAHEAGLKIILWNEGDILPILDLEAALDIDAFAFEQPRKGVDITVDKVRAVFGKERCLFGNLDSELLLKRNNPEEIKAETEKQILMSGEGAPFVLCTGSPIPSDVQPEAVDAMIAASRNFRW